METVIENRVNLFLLKFSIKEMYFDVQTSIYCENVDDTCIYIASNSFLNDLFLFTFNVSIICLYKTIFYKDRLMLVPV